MAGYPDLTGEERLLVRVLGAAARSRPELVVVGPGDDAGAIRWPDGSLLLLTTDAAEEGVHFDRRLYLPLYVGRRAIGAAVSDIAAMGGSPLATVVSLVTHPEDEDFAEMVSRGASGRAWELGARVVGGNITTGDRLALHITVAGLLPPGVAPLCRSGARPGDTLFVTGALGAAALGLELLRGPPEERESLAAARLFSRHLSPEPRLDAGAAAVGVATAAIDISDGFALDLHRLAEASGVGALVEADRLPLAQPDDAGFEAALFGGEDYELLLTGPDPGIPQALKDAFVPVTAIGRITPPEAGVRLRRSGGPPEPLPRRGWDSWKLERSPRTPPPPR